MCFGRFFVKFRGLALFNGYRILGALSDTRSQTITINFADQLGFAVNYLYSTFSTGVHTLATPIAFFFIYFYNVSQDHSKTLSNPIS
jgi:hypothetical protein